MKRLRFLGSSRKDFSHFPPNAQKLAGYGLQLIQQGLQPRDFKPMPTIGSGVQELRVWVEVGTYRVIYLARLEEAVYVLHAFEKKTQATEKADLDLARERYKNLLRR